MHPDVLQNFLSHQAEIQQTVASPRSRRRQHNAPPFTAGVRDLAHSRRSGSANDSAAYKQTLAKLPLLVDADNNLEGRASTLGLVPKRGHGEGEQKLGAPAAYKFPAPSNLYDDNQTFESLTLGSVAHGESTSGGGGGPPLTQADRRRRARRRRVRKQELELHEESSERWIKRHGGIKKSAFTVGQKRELKRWFDQMDSDGSGTIDVQELEGPLLSTGIASSVADVAKLISSVDADSSGTISFEEFLKVMVSRPAGSAPAAGPSGGGGGGRHTPRRRKGGGTKQKGRNGGTSSRPSVHPMVRLQRLQQNGLLELESLISIERRKRLMGAILFDTSLLPTSQERQNRIANDLVSAMIKVVHHKADAARKLAAAQEAPKALRTARPMRMNAGPVGGVLQSPLHLLKGKGISTLDESDDDDDEKSVGSSTIESSDKASWYTASSLKVAGAHPGVLSGAAVPVSVGLPQLVEGRG